MNAVMTTDVNISTDSANVIDAVASVSKRNAKLSTAGPAFNGNPNAQENTSNKIVFIAVPHKNITPIRTPEYLSDLLRSSACLQSLEPRIVILSRKLAVKTT